MISAAVIASSTVGASTATAEAGPNLKVIVDQQDHDNKISV